MKTAHRNLHIAVLAVSLALLSLSSAYSAAGESKPVISKKELKVLLKTAKEPVEHQKIADYYRQESARLIRSAKEHEDLAKLYTDYPPYPGMVSKHGTDFGQGAPHCRKWAELDGQQAKEAEALALMHEDMAKAAAQKQQ
jgi:hypothetical protein